MSRRRFLYTMGGQPLPEPIEVDLDWRDPGRETPHRSEEEVFGHVTATDGTDLSTRRRYNEYMKAKGLAHADDYKEHWAKKEQERAELFTGSSRKQSKAIRESVERAFYKLTKY